MQTALSLIFSPHKMRSPNHDKTQESYLLVFFDLPVLVYQVCIFALIWMTKSIGATFMIRQFRISIGLHQRTGHYLHELGHARNISLALASCL